MTDTTPGEKAYLLTSGEAEFEWEGHKAAVRRTSRFDEEPWCLHVPSSVSVSVTGTKECELSVYRTANAASFESRLFSPEDCQVARPGAGIMNEAATRIVRTIFNKTNRPQSNLVLGETINLPGKWSSYPPHWHQQPEIYFYSFNPEDGFGYSEVGGKVHRVKANDAVLIRPEATHPQVAAPGYAMYYAWAIRHLEGLPYTGPTDVPEYSWLTRADATSGLSPGRMMSGTLSKTPAAADQINRWARFLRYMAPQ